MKKLLKRIKIEITRPNVGLTKFFIYSLNYLICIFLPRKGNYGRPYLVWDARKESIAFDFTCFILNAYNVFEKKGYSNFDLIIYNPTNFKPSPFEWKDYNLHVKSSELTNRINEMIYKLASSFECISKIHLVSEIKDMYNLMQLSSFIYPVNYHPIFFQPQTFNYKKLHYNLMKSQDYIIPKIIPNSKYSKELKDFYSTLKNKEYITLTLRDYGFSPKRNTSDRDFKQAIKLAKKLNLKLVLVPDKKENLVNYSITSDCLICFTARDNLFDRINLYAQSNLNIFQTSGPAYIPLFIKGSKTIMVDAGKGGFDNDEKHWKIDHNLHPGDQPYKKMGCFMMWYKIYKEYDFEDLYKVYIFLKSSISF